MHGTHGLPARGSRPSDDRRRHSRSSLADGGRRCVCSPATLPSQAGAPSLAFPPTPRQLAWGKSFRAGNTSLVASRPVFVPYYLRADGIAGFLHYQPIRVATPFLVSKGIRFLRPGGGAKRSECAPRTLLQAERFLAAFPASIHPPQTGCFASFGRRCRRIESTTGPTHHPVVPSAGRDQLPDERTDPVTRG